jgi:hypothetical protein
VDHAIESAVALVHVVDDRCHDARVCDVAGDDFDRGRDCFEGRQPAQPFRAGVSPGVRTEVLVAFLARRDRFAGHDDEAGAVGFGEPAGQCVAHAAETAGDEIGPAGDDRRRSLCVGRRALPMRGCTPVAAARHDSGGGCTRFGDDAGGLMIDRAGIGHVPVDVDEHCRDVRIFLGCDAGKTHGQRVGRVGRGDPGSVGCVAGHEHHAAVVGLLP